MTRPNISFAVNRLSQFLQSPIEVHWGTCKRVLRHLISTRHYGLYFRLASSLNIIGFFDADYARYQDDRRPVSGHTICYIPDFCIAVVA